MPKTAEITIDGQPHTLSELRPRENAAWRARCQAQADELVGLLDGLQGVEINRVEDLPALAKQFMPALLQKAGEVWALCCAYDPAFENAYESEAVEAVPRILELAFPFGGLVKTFRGLTGGRTSPSSPSASGGAGTTS